MAGFRQGLRSALAATFLVLLILWPGSSARAADPPAEQLLYEQPVLTVDLGMHTAPITSAAVDRDGRFAVTASHDKTVRIWSMTDGQLQRTIRMPAGPGNTGKIFAV